MIWIYLSAILVLVIFVDKWLRYEEFEKIPGPKGLFIVENALDFLMDPVKLFYNFRNLANKYKQLFKLKICSKRFVIIHNPEDVEVLISGTKYNAKGFMYSFIEPWLKEGLLLSDGPKWHQRRKILTPTFHFNILRHFHTVLEDNSKRFAEQLETESEKPKTALSPYISDFTLHSICETAMGTKLDEEATDSGKSYKDGIFKLGEYVVYRAQRVWLYANLMFSLSPTGRKQKETLNHLSSFRDKVINKRRAKNEFDQCFDIANSEVDDTIPTKKKLAMLDLLLKAEKEGIIDAAGIGEEVDTFMFEGHDTTANALNCTFMLLANNSECQDKIISEWNRVVGPSFRPTKMADLAELKYLEACIKESLRLYPPVHFIIRKLNEPLKLKDYNVPANTDCVVLIFDLQRRADQFKEPLEFRPERFLKEATWHPYSYIPFSAGPRNCIGQKFAMMEMKLSIASVLLKYRLLPVTAPKDVVFITDFILRPCRPIYVKLQKRT